MNRRRDAVAAAAVYAAATIVWTWPLAAGLARDVPADFGDPLLNAWILAWDATHLGRGWWSANIFFPHPLALAYSEHLLPQALTILPVYAVTRNPILCYNLVFLSTFVLSGLGMFLLARELTGSRAGALVAGLAFAFAPYRVASLPHVQVLSSAWMPFAIYGFRRYFTTGRWRPLAGGAAAWLLQNLSCGYYLLFFSPIVVLYLAWEIVSRRASGRTIAAVAAAAASVALLTAPFVLPYLELRRLGFGPRPLIEVVRFSADTFAYFTADPNLRLWGPIARGWSAAEGALFPGLVITILALSGARGVDPSSPRSPERLALLALAPVVLLALPLLNVHLPFIRTASVSRTAVFALAISAILLTASRPLRDGFRGWLGSPVPFLVAATVFAIAMSFGPQIHARGRPVGDGVLYAFAYARVPGYDGLRVPARFGMIAAFGLAALTAFAVRDRRAAVVLAALILAESWPAPIPINQNDTVYRQLHLAPLPPRISASDDGELYRFVAQLPDPAAIVELPLGESAFDVRYMFYSTRHWKRLVNGYSGGVPADYERLDQDLRDAIERPARAWQALVRTGATYVVVHEAFYTDGRGSAIAAWLRSSGAHEIAAFGANRVLVLK